MGKQVRFFMAREDEKQFLDAIQQFGRVKLIYNTFSSESQMEVRSLEAAAGAIDAANLSLVNPSLGSAVKQTFYLSQSYHCLDLAESEVVQFERCKPITTWLARGRLWFEEKSSQGKKPADFLKWANSLLKWVQDNYDEDAAGNLVAPRALELSRAGKLQLGPPVDPPVSLEERKRILGLQ